MTYQLSDSEIAKLRELKQYLAKRAKDIEANRKREEGREHLKEQMRRLKERKKMRLISKADGASNPYG